MKWFLYLLMTWNGLHPSDNASEMTREILLIRHAKSSWDNPNLTDFDRPLAERGLRDAPVMANELAKHRIPIDLVIASPSVRTTQTLEYFRATLKIPQERIVWDSTVFHSSTENLLRILSALDDSVRHVVFVGHNPSMTDLSNALQSDTLIDNVPTCGIVHISGSWSSWKELRQQKGKLEFFLYPKMFQP